jgi:hypothetical protein
MKRGERFKNITGKERGQLRPRLNLRGKAKVRNKSKYPPLILGTDEQWNPFWISMEQLKSHLHIMGATQLGKSKLALYLMREIIKRGNGLCLIDPSFRGDTCYQLLAFIEEFNKTAEKKVNVLLIDLRRDKNPVLNPFHASKYKTAAYLDDAFRVLFQVTDAATTANISKYLPAVIHVLWNAGKIVKENDKNKNIGLVEAKYFTDPIYEKQREWILERSAAAERKFNLDPHHRIVIQSAHYYPRLRERFLSTTGRLEPIIHPAVEALFGADSTVNVPNLIAEDWVILANVDNDDLTQLQRRLVATVLINEIIYGIRVLDNQMQKQGKKWEKRYYLFIDEAGEYATPKLAELLNLMSKSGLTVAFMNQDYSHFENEKLLGAVKKNAKNKIFFGEDAGYLVGEALKTQHAAVKLDGMDPVKLRIPDVPDVYVNAETIAQLHEHKIYRPRKEVLNDISKHVPYSREDIVPPGSRKNADRRADGPDDVPRGRKGAGVPAGDGGDQKSTQGKTDQSQAERLWGETPVLPPDTEGTQ